MLSSLFQNNIQPAEVTHEEGELYKVVTTFGKTFELRYGYYEECDRQSPLAMKLKDTCSLEEKL